MLEGVTIAIFILALSFVITMFGWFIVSVFGWWFLIAALPIILVGYALLYFVGELEK